jgi:hypothetical protein
VIQPAPVPAAAVPTAPLDVADLLFVTDQHGNPYRLVLQDQPVLGKGFFSVKT